MSRTQVAFLVILAVVLTTAVGNNEDLPQDYYNSRLVNSMGNRRLGRLFWRFLEDAETSVERPEKRKPCFLSGVTGPLCDYADVKDARKEHAWLEENSPGKRLVV